LKRSSSFATFYGQRRTDDFYSVPGRGHHVIRSAGVEVSHSPHLSTDYVALALSRIDAVERNCALKIAVLSIAGYRSAIIDELVRIRGLGCSVQLAFADEYGNAISRLTAAGVKVRPAHGVGIHSKMMLYRGRYDGLPNRRMVWGGSHNWTGKSLGSDEVFVAVENAGLYQSYKTYFDTIWESLGRVVGPAP
jgi:PLD-like domain